VAGFYSATQPQNAAAPWPTIAPPRTLGEALTGIHDGSRGFLLEWTVYGWSELECAGHPGNDTVAQQHRDSERLGHPFNPARRVNRVANHRDLALPRMADAAEDHRAEVNSDADAQGNVELALERWSASLYRFQHSERGAHGVPEGRSRRLVAGAEDSQDAIPDVLVNKAVVVEHRLGGRREVAIQHVHDIIGQALLAVGREVPNISEEDREIEFPRRRRRFNLIPVYADATGIVAEVLHEETEDVKKGDLLIRLDAQRARAALGEAEGELGRAVRAVGAPGAVH
jgi:hypothetical protein